MKVLTEEIIPELKQKISDAGVGVLDELTDAPAANDVYGAGYVNERLDSRKIALGSRAANSSRVSATNYEIAIGYNAKTNNATSNASSTSVAIGANSSVSGVFPGVAIGSSAKTTNDFGVAIGGNATSGTSAVSLGHDAQATSTYGVAIGEKASAAHTRSVALGYSAKTARAGEVSIGDSSATSNPTRYLANVTAGVFDTDAVNLKQMNDSIAEETSARENAIQELQNQVQSDFADYYTKTETDQMVSAIPKFAIEVVDTLPTSDISSTTVYLVPSGSNSPDVYTEYIYVSDKWEQLGVQTVDLTNYYTKTEVDATFAVKTELSNYLTTSTASSTYVPQDRTINGQPLTGDITLDIPEETQIVQELGTSETAVMSQAGVNAIVGDIATVLESI